MISLLPIIFSTPVMIQFFLGNFANGFIALVNFIDWVKKRKISSADRILTALAVSRIGLLCVILMHWYISVFDPDFSNTKVRIIIHSAWILANHFSIWLATSLSIFYLLKIANFSNCIFLNLKRNVTNVILVILLGTLVFLLCHLVVGLMNVSMQQRQHERNGTWETKLRNTVYLSAMAVATLENFLPFTVSLISFLLLIYSLCKHLKKMQLHGKGSQDTSTKVHVKALQTVISFLLLIVIYFLSLVISFWNSDRQSHKTVLVLCQAIGIIYPSSHSFFLIWGNRKLKQSFLSVLWQLKCWLKGQKLSMA
ncbi:taste receptor type 2 member 20-like [Tupaia chinensis]|uniref:taste receptor type 2 member 20-like n=1 Tax=Tupaia chinensis TaxID=246437 RepID=UPI0003C9072D|nr:taste receptor type 2 member 20-like [Tupaia chinensis]